MTLSRSEDISKEEASEMSHLEQDKGKQVETSFQKI